MDDNERKMWRSVRDLGSALDELGKNQLEIVKLIALRLPQKTEEDERRLLALAVKAQQQQQIGERIAQSLEPL